MAKQVSVGSLRAFRFPPKPLQKLSSVSLLSPTLLQRDDSVSLEQHLTMCISTRFPGAKAAPTAPGSTQGNPLKDKQDFVRQWRQDIQGKRNDT